MRKSLIEINHLEHDPSAGGGKVLMTEDFPGQGLYVWGRDLYIVNGDYVNLYLLDDPHWLEVFCSSDKPASALQNSVSESFILKLIAVTQNPSLAESLALEK